MAYCRFIGEVYAKMQLIFLENYLPVQKIIPIFAEDLAKGLAIPAICVDYAVRATTLVLLTPRRPSLPVDDVQPPLVRPAGSPVSKRSGVAECGKFSLHTTSCPVHRFPPRSAGFAGTSARQVARSV